MESVLAFQDTKLADLALHFVGNQFNDESLVIGKTKLAFNEDVEKDLLTYFLSSFKEKEYYNLHHESDLKLNEVFSYASAIFEYPEGLYLQSINLAKHLYEHSTHPNTKGGEFYVVYLQNVLLEGEIMDAIGLFKSENKDTFLKIKNNDNGFEIDSQQGINISKLDKGCIIFNTDKENGYVLSVVDNTNKGSDAKYWFDHFLHVNQRNDSYFQTENVMAMTKAFITKELPKEFEASKADQVDLLKRSVAYFKEQEEFDLSEFANTVMAQPDIIEHFEGFKTAYATERAISMEDKFELNDKAVKKKQTVFKSVIKLDKNFHIYVHGNKDKIERHTDADGNKYYKLYFDEET